MLFVSKTSRVLAVLASLALVVTGLASLPKASQAAVASIWSVDFNSSSTGDWSQSGGDGSTLTYVPDPDNASNTVLAVARTADYVGVQSPAGVLVPGTVYNVSMKVRLADPAAGAASFRFVGKPGYDWIANTDGVTGTAWTTVSGAYTVPAGADQSQVQLYIGTGAASVAGETYAYLVDDINVTTEGAPTDPNACVPGVTAIHEAGFETSTDSWGGRGATVGESTESRTGAKSLAVTGRTSGWNGAALDVSTLFDKGSYTVTAWVKLPAGAAATTGINMGVNQPGASNEYPWLGSRLTVGADTWVQLTGTYVVDEATPPTSLYFESESATQDFLIDDVTITTDVVCNVGPEPGSIAISTDFEEGLDGWGPRDNGTGAPTVAITTADVHAGAQAALVSARTSQGSGIGFDVTKVLEPGATYELTAWLKFAQTPTEDIWLTLQNTASEGASTTYQTLAQFTGMSAGEWVQVSATFTMPATIDALLYFETAYDGRNTGNTSSFAIDDILVKVPEPAIVQDLPPLKDAVPFPLGVAIDSRETTGASADLLLKHFNQITPENFMKPEAWYDADGNWAPKSAEIDSLMDFAADNNIRLYGHVLVWHSQTPDWFFEHSDGTPLTNSEADKQLLRDRMRTHINNVAEYLADGWGPFGSETNPLVAFDVVNEVIDDGSAYSDGMRRSRWYQVLGEEFVDLAFEYANEAFNDTYAAPSATHPVTLFINDYNTEQAGKRARYLALIDRALDRGAPIDGIGHQFHLNLSIPVSTLEDALTDASRLGLKQAVTEFDVTTGTPESRAKFIDQGYYYRDAFAIFRDHNDELFSVTVWGLIDSRSWRDSSGGPLVFDDGLQAKPAYYGIVDSEDAPLPDRLRTADVFAGTVPITAAGVDAPAWSELPLKAIERTGAFQLRWAPDHLTAYVTVDDPGAGASDEVTFTVGENTYTVTRSGTGDVPVAVKERSGGYELVASLPLDPAGTEGANVSFDVSVAGASAAKVGWNSPGVLGTLTLVEALSTVKIPQASSVPVIDGIKDAVWSEATNVKTLKQVSGTNGAIGTFHLLWKGSNLYIYAEIADSTIDVTGSDPWTQDSVEIYVDPGNVKNGSYRYDDTQVRINAFNAVSFGTGDEAFQAGRVSSAAVRGADGYVIEAAISLLDSSGLGTFHGVDFQVNDAANGARSSIRNWADPTGAGYQSTARWGVGELVKGAEPPVVDPTPDPVDPTSPPLKDEQLTAANQSCVDVPDFARPGDAIAIALCAGNTGKQVSAYMYSDPVLIGSGTVSAAGLTSGTIPAKATLGTHKIAVYDAQGRLIGWAPITVVERDGGGLALTGAEWVPLALFAALLVLAGTAVLTSRPRRAKA